MVDIIEEIVNEEKDAKRLHYFQKLFAPIIIFTVIIALLIAFWGYYSKKKEEHNQEIGDIFVEVPNNKVNSEEYLDNGLGGVIATSGNNLEQLAKIKLAAHHIQKGKKESAAELLKGMIEDKSSLEVTKAYARIILLSMIIDNEDINESDKLEASNLLNYFSSPEKPLFATGTLFKSLFYLKINQLDLAEQYANQAMSLEGENIIIREQASVILNNIKYKK